MALSDCPQCWNTPCTCGYDYKHWSLAVLIKFREMIDGVITKKQAEIRSDFDEDAHCPSFGRNDD
jgi:hypothetical protein